MYEKVCMREGVYEVCIWTCRHLHVHMSQGQGYPRGLHQAQGPGKQHPRPRSDTGGWGKGSWGLTQGKWGYAPWSVGVHVFCR